MVVSVIVRSAGDNDVAHDDVRHAECLLPKMRADDVWFHTVDELALFVHPDGEVVPQVDTLNESANRIAQLLVALSLEVKDLGGEVGVDA